MVWPDRRGQARFLLVTDNCLRNLFQRSLTADALQGSEQYPNRIDVFTRQRNAAEWSAVVFPPHAKQNDFAVIG